jgi:hypothetical protein
MNKFDLEERLCSQNENSTQRITRNIDLFESN